MGVFLLALLRFLTGPVSRDHGSSGSSNNVFVIKLGMQTPYPAAVLVQERFEQAITRLIFLAIGVPLGIAAGHYAHPIAGIVLAMLSVLIAFVPPVRRWRESRGTALDIAVAVRLGADLEAYEERKVTARMGYAVFDDWPRERVKALFVSLRPWAGRHAKVWM